MSLTGNKSNYDPAAATKSIAGAMGNISKNLPKKSRRSAISNYSNLAKNVSTKSSYQPGTKTSLGTVSVPYGGSTRYEKFHPGIDIANKIGTPIPSFTSGTISGIMNGKKQGDKGYGNYVIVTDAQGNKHRYSHLSNSFVKMGQQVEKGTILGGMSNSGSTYSTSGGTGSHLDYRVRDLYNKYLNPNLFVNN